MPFIEGYENKSYTPGFIFLICLPMSLKQLPYYGLTIGLHSKIPKI